MPKLHHQFVSPPTSGIASFVKMKGIYSRHLKGALQEGLAKALPNFEAFPLRLSKAERKYATSMPGEHIFVWRVASNLWVFLAFIPHRTQERILADIGWSTQQRFPWDIQRPTVWLNPNNAEQTMEECMIGFSDLLNRETGSGVFFGWDVWKCSVEPEHPDYYKVFVAEDLRPVTEDEAVRRTNAGVATAISDISRYAMPYIDALILRRQEP